MAAGTRNHVAEADHESRREVVGKDSRCGAAHRIVDRVDEGLIAQNEILAWRDVGEGRERVSAIEDSRAYVKTAVGWKPVHAGLGGPEVQIGVVVDAIDREGIAEGKDICADAEVDAAQEWRGQFEARAQCAGLEA